MAIEITIHGTQNGVCSLSGKDCEGLVVSFHDEGEGEILLSQKSFLALVKMKMAKNGKPKGKQADPKSNVETMGRTPPMPVATTLPK